MKYIEPTDRNQLQLIVNSLEDLVPPDHAVRIIDAIVDSIVNSNRDRFEKTQAHDGVGRPCYHASTHLKLFLYGYFNGISSSRKLEVETYRNKEVIWLLGDLKPDHWTISNYRKDHAEEIKFVTRRFREFLRDSGYITLKTVAIDGTKVKAYTNRNMLTKEMIETKLTAIDKEIEEYFQKLSKNDSRDELLDEVDDQVKENVNEKYLTKIEELQRQVELLQQQKNILQQEGRRNISRADQDARLMKSRDGMIPAYNVQMITDGANKMIADSEVITKEIDLGLLPEMIKSLKEELGQCPKEVIVDNGYYTSDLIEELEKQAILNGEELEIFAAPDKTSRDKEEVKFTYDKEKDEYLCSEGKRLLLVARNVKKKQSLINVYQGIDCNGCPLREKCTKSKKGRLYQRHINQEWRDQMKAKMTSGPGKAKMALRRQIVEHPFGTIKYLMGKIPLLLRGIKKVSTEINLYTTVYNLKRLINIEAFGSLKIIIENYKWETA